MQGRIEVSFIQLLRAEDLPKICRTYAQACETNKFQTGHKLDPEIGVPAKCLILWRSLGPSF
jgi:hypothetical protein